MKWYAPFYLFFSMLIVGSAFGQDTNQQDTLVSVDSVNQYVSVVSPSGYPVVVGEDTLFYLTRSQGSMSAEERALIVSERLKRILEEPDRDFQPVRIVPDSLTLSIRYGDRLIMTLVPADSTIDFAELRSTAVERAQTIQSVLNQDSAVVARTESAIKTIDWKALGIGILLALAVSLIFWLAARYIGRGVVSLQNKLNQWRDTRIPALRMQKFQIASSSQVTDALIGLTKILRIVAILILIYFYIPLIFSFFPWTRGFATTLFGYILSPVKSVLLAIVSYLPDLFFLIVIGGLTHLLLKLVHRFFIALARGYITFSGFYKDWAIPTYKIVRFLIIAFALVVAFPYLPGSSSPAFKGISIFFGVLFSLGSTSAVANIVAGAVITYMRPFKIGDRVKIADTTGDVIEKTLLVTRIQTIKNVEVTIPNATVLASHIINFSASASDDGLILYTTVTIGYDVPRITVENLLLEAARATKGVVENPAPFVLLTSLNDYHISYELNAAIKDSHIMAQINSDLNANIIDKFNEAGVEIMSPGYTAVRDGNRTAIPDDYLPKEYSPPAFRFWPWSKKD
ncbi:mechanosensitive ion channel family protein [bacterium]|nr:MAG: mechanosensitive ion channel family protein [bacterium]